MDKDFVLALVVVAALSQRDGGGRGEGGPARPQRGLRSPWRGRDQVPAAWRRPWSGPDRSPAGRRKAAAEQQVQLPPGAEIRICVRRRAGDDDGRRAP